MEYPAVQCALRGGVRVPLPFPHTAVTCEEHNAPGHVDYGTIMRVAWQQYPDAVGMLWLEGDIAIEQLHLDEIAQYVEQYPGYVVAVPFRLYPVSTHLPDVRWAHAVATPEGHWHIVSADIPCPVRPAAFGIGCTFLPSMLLHEAMRYMDNWDHPVLDGKLSRLAHDNGIKCVTTPTPAVHLHY